MMRSLPLVLVSSSLLATLHPSTAEAGGCQAPIAVYNSRIGWADSGGFDFAGTPIATAGKPEAEKSGRVPDVRFWGYKHFQTANSGTQAQNTAGGEWLVSPNRQLNLTEAAPSVFALYQANWMGGLVTGCAFNLTDKRTVLEISLVDSELEGKVEHRGFYAVASVDYDPAQSSYDFDAVRGAGGKGGNVVPVLPIPAPRVVSTAAGSAGFVTVNLDLEAPVSFSEKGKDAVKVIAGYRVLYATGAAPTSSDPSRYQRVRDAAAPTKEAGVLKPGAVAVAVPSGKPVWLVAQVVYEDPASVLSRATSAHTAVDLAAAPVDSAPAGARVRTGVRTR